mmetsp:Transcript_6428/g.8450  ORF Transcript_6428/g.8450 Transcript_6428/m.8450 type:complete len:814 (-) Transcript_6428:470-2911(-)
MNNNKDGNAYASSKKLSWSSALFTSETSSVTATAKKSPSSPEVQDDLSPPTKHMSSQEWTLVSGSGAAAKPSPSCLLLPQSASSAKKKALTQNKFFVQAGMEKDLHKPTKGQGQQNEHSAMAKDNLKCFKRNQRRKRQRAQKRAQKKTGNDNQGSSCIDEKESIEEIEEVDAQFHLLAMPADICNATLGFLGPGDLLRFGECNKQALSLSRDAQLWQKLYKKDHYNGKLAESTGIVEWKLAYQLEATGLIQRLRCSYTKQTFFEDSLGCGVDFSINPKTQRVDYINMSQEILSMKAFDEKRVRSDVFGKDFKLFLPLYFSEEHFKRALPRIRKTIVRLCPERKVSRFEPLMVLDVLPKIVNTFVVLVSDEGLSASRKSFDGLLRTHRLFLALANQYPEIKKEALRRLRQFALKEEFRTKGTCPSLGNIIPLMTVVDEGNFSWKDMCLPYLSESFDRSVLWICKAHPKLERTCGPSGRPESAKEAEERVALSREAMAVSMRLNMFHVYFLRACCKGTTEVRSQAYDIFYGRKESDEDRNPGAVTRIFGLDLSFKRFNRQVSQILAAVTWQEFFKLVSARCPQSKVAMAQMLRQSVKNSRRKGYHRAGMDFSRVQASGTSQILSKGQTYSASSEIRRVRFQDDWTFAGSTVFLDATCLLFRGRHLSDTIDYQNTVLHQRHPHRRNAYTDILAVEHSGDVMRDGGGTHTIDINLDALDGDITSCIFVISAWADATLSDMTSASISFVDPDAGPDSAPLCTYNLDAHDKIAHLTSVIMCKLYRSSRNGGWHVLAIGDAHGGSADNYGPIHSAAKALL